MTPPEYAPLVCADCSDPVDPNSTGVWKQVTGWVEVRKGGGAHAVSMPTPPQAWLCKVCMMIRKRGNRGMGSLFD